MKPLGVFLAALSSSVLQAKQCTISNADIVHVTSLYGSPGADGGEGGLSGFDGCFDPETSENKCELRYRRLLRRRSSGILQCTGNEDCVRLDGEDEAFCYNAATEDFHLGDGTIGNLKNGDYTSSGEKGNLWKYSVSTPTPSAGPITGGFATFTPSATTTVRTPSAGPVTETFATFTPSATTTSSTRSSGSSSTATGESATTTAGTQTSTGAPVATSSAPPSGGERVVALRWNEMVLGSGGVVFALLWL